jgi:xylan 1,4-beta-xylosidase
MRYITIFFKIKGDRMKFQIVPFIIGIAGVLTSGCGQPAAPEPGLVIQVDLNHKKGPMKPVWAWFGYDEPNYTYMEHGKKLLTEIAEVSPVPVYVRAHNLLTTGDGTPALKWGSTNAYTEDHQGNPVYHWPIVDSIFDTYIERGMRPLVEIGFMPEALSSKPQPYKHQWKPGAEYSDIYTGWSYPPADYEKWAELVYQWVIHCVDRYGKEEVEQWFWEPWNEPNIGYWQGTTEEYIKLYDDTADSGGPSARCRRVWYPGGNVVVSMRMPPRVSGCLSITSVSASVSRCQWPTGTYACSSS